MYYKELNEEFYDLKEIFYNEIVIKYIDNNIFLYDMKEITKK